MAPSPMGECLRDSKLDVMVAVSPENVHYLCGVPILTQRLILPEPSILSPLTTQELQPGTVLAEPLTHSPDGIFPIEDMVEVTDGGTRRLSEASRWAALPEVG
jgi:hypothetical protein